MRIILFFIAFLYLSASAWSQGEPPLVTDRPDQTESSSVVPSCRLQIESGFSHEWVKTGGEEYKGNTSYGATLLRFGVLPFLELRLGTDLLNHRSKIPAGALQDEFGMSPIGLGFKAALFGEKGIRPQLAFITAWQIPKTGRESFSSDKWQHSYVFAFSHALSVRWGLGYNLGYEFEGAFEVNRFIYSLVLGYALTEKWGVFLETYGNKTSSNPLDIRTDAGFTWPVLQNLQLDLSGGLGITKVSPVGFVSAGFSWRIPR